MIIKWHTKFKLTHDKWVFVPNANSREKGLAIKLFLVKKWKFPCYYWHLRDQGHIGAITSHLDDLYFYKFDLQNFFSQINKSKITRALTPIVGYKSAREITTESTVKNPDYNSENNMFILPYGFIQSPIIASIALHSSILGKYIQVLTESFNVSIYMDDIIISSRHPIDPKIVTELDWYSRLAKLPIQHTKTQGPSGKITVFNIDLSYKSLIVTPKRLNQFKTAYIETSSEDVRAGILNYLLSVNAALYKNFPN